MATEFEHTASSTGFIEGYSDIDHAIMQHIGNFSKTQFASVNKHCNKIARASQRVIAAPDNFTWFIGAIMDGNIPAVQEYVKKFPQHVSKYFIPRDAPSLREWSNLDKIGCECAYLKINSVFIAAMNNNEDLVLLLALPSDTLPTNSCNHMPRVIARLYNRQEQYYAIYIAYVFDNYKLLDTLHRTIGAAFRDNEMITLVYDAVMEAVLIGDRLKVLHAIEYRWIRRSVALDLLPGGKYPELEAEIRAKY